MTSALSVCSKAVVLAAIVAALAGFSAPTADARAEDRSPVIDINTGNAEMNAAIAQARATLPKFWTSYEAPKSSETGHSLKVRFPTRRNDGEHIWIAEVKKIADGRYSGKFANAPRDLPGKRAGDVIEFKEADISDWMFTRNGKIVGGETIKPLLKSMPKADADALRADGDSLKGIQGQVCRHARVKARSASSRWMSPGIHVLVATRLPGRGLAGKRRTWPTNPKNPRN